MGNASKFTGKLKLSKPLSREGENKFDALKKEANESEDKGQRSKLLGFYSQNFSWICTDNVLKMPDAKVKAYYWERELTYICEKILKPEGITLSGSIERVGEYREQFRVTGKNSSFFTENYMNFPYRIVSKTVDQDFMILKMQKIPEKKRYRQDPEVEIYNHWVWKRVAEDRYYA